MLARATFAQSPLGVLVAWDPNPEADLAGYHIYYGGQSRTYTNRVTVDKLATSVRVEPLLAGGTYYLAIKAFNTAGAESLPSNELTNRVPSITNLPPTLDALGDLAVNEDPGLRAVYLSGISAGGSETQPLLVRATSSNPSLIPVPRIFYSTPENFGWLVYSAAPNAAGSSTISVTVDDGQLANNTVTRSFVVSVAPLNDPPVISSVPNQIMREDMPGAPLTISVSDVDSPVNTLVVTARSSNPSLIPSEYVMMGGTGNQRDMLIVPQLDQSGTAIITLEVRDPQGASSSTFFSVLVDGVNDDPVITPVGDQILTEDTPSPTLVFYVFDAETLPDQLGVIAQSSNPQLIPDENLVITGTSNARTLTFVPAPEQYGSSLIQLWVYDPEGFYSGTHFEVVVRPGNDPPVILPVADLVLNEDTLSSPVQVTVSDSETAAGDLILSASSSNPALVENEGFSFSGGNGQRSFTVRPRPQQFGSSVVRLTVTDLNGASSSVTFVVTVNPVNDPPNLDPIPDLTLDEGSGALTVPLFGINSGAPNELQTLTVNAVSSRPDIIPLPQVTYLNPNNFGAVILAPLPHTNGATVITVSVSDGPPPNNVTSRSFNVLVRAFNNPPVISSLPDLAVVRLLNPEVINFNLQDPDSKAGSLVVTGYSSDPTLLPNANLVFGGTGTQRTLTVHPVPGRTGLAVVTVVASDGDATVSTSFYVLVTAAGV